MAEEVQYASSGVDSAAAAATSKRKYEDQATPPPLSSAGGGRRTTGFSAPIMSQSPDSAPPTSYNNVPPPVDEIQQAKAKAQEIAARLFNSAEAKRPKFENGGGGFDSGFSPVPSSDVGQKPTLNSSPSIPSSYGYGTPSKKIDIPNGRVGVIIGKGGETIKYLQLQSGAKIQVTRDVDADPHSLTRAVELTGSAESISKAEQLIKDVLSEAESGGSGIVSQRVTPGQPGGADQFVMKVPNNKVGLIIGKGGDTIKTMQANSGARIQVIPLHLPPGDMSTERSLQIDGSSDQIEAAKQLVNEVIGENRLRNPMSGGYSQQGYHARPATSWAPPAPQMQQGYGYVQPGAYSGQSAQYNMSQPPYANYPPQQTPSGYATGWDQTTGAPTQQATQGGGYDYYSQQQAPPSQAPGAPAGSTDNSAYGYNQQGQAYTQDGYGGYPAPASQSGYVQPQTGYDQQQGYGNPTPGYNVTNQTSEGRAISYGAQGDNTNQAPAPIQSSAPQSGYGQQPSPNPSYQPQGSTQPAYGVPPTSQAGYGSQPLTGYGPTNYGPPQTQKPPVSQPGYVQQPQQSPTAAQGGYAQPAPLQPGYPQSGYPQPDPAVQRAPPSGYGPGYATAPYGAAPVTQPGYGGQQPQVYNSAYGSAYPQQPQGYSTETAPASQAVQPSGAVAKSSPKS